MIHIIIMGLIALVLMFAAVFTQDPDKSLSLFTAAMVVGVYVKVLFIERELEKRP